MLSKPDVVAWFIIYFMGVSLVVVLVSVRVRLLKIVLKIAGPFCFGGYQLLHTTWSIISGT